MTRNEAEIIALKGLEFLARSAPDLERFLAESGAESADFRLSSADPHFLAAVVDFLLAGDQLLLRFCAAECVSPNRIHLACRELHVA